MVRLRLFDRYVRNTIGLSILTVLLVIVGIDTIGTLMDEQKALSSGFGNYYFKESWIYVLTIVPSTLPTYIPLASLIGCLLGLGALANSSELVVMRAAGTSVFRLAWIALKPALALLLIGTLIGEFVAPPLERYAENKKLDAKYLENNVVTTQGLWNREGNEFVHIRQIEMDGLLKGVTIYRFSPNRTLESAIFAKTASFEQKEKDWTLHDVEQTIFSDTQVQKITQKSLLWQSQLSPSLVNILILKPSRLSMRELYSYASYINKQSVNADEYWLAFWKKALRPVEGVGFVLIAISFIFGPLRSATMGSRMVAGIAVGMAFKMLQDLLAPASMLYGFSSFSAVALPMLLCFICAWYLLKRSS